MKPCFSNHEIMKICFRCDEQSEKVKSNASKWSFCRRNKSSRDQVDGNPLTEAGVARMYRLILFLCREESKLSIEAVY